MWYQKTEFRSPWGGFVDFLVFPKDSEGESWGLARNFKTSNGSLKTLPTSIRGRLWKVCFLGPRHGSAGSPVFCEGPERVSQGSDSKLQNVQRELKNAPHVDSWTSLESMLSGTQARFRGVPSDLRGSRTGFPGPPRGNPLDSMEYSKQVAVASKWDSRNDS